MTPMIGQNDVPTDRLDIGGAQAIADFAADKDLGRTSLWSLNRDGPCGPQVDDNKVSNSCSGVEQTPGEFSRLFLGAVPTDPGPATDQDDQEPTRDDPARSPYPIWRSTKVYDDGDKVVWQGGVYEARWWSRGDSPSEAVDDLWDTPWRYLGPVLESDAEALR